MFDTVVVFRGLKMARGVRLVVYPTKCSTRASIFDLKSRAQNETPRCEANLARISRLANSGCATTLS